MKSIIPQVVSLAPEEHPYISGLDLKQPLSDGAIRKITRRQSERKGIKSDFHHHHHHSREEINRTIAERGRRIRVEWASQGEKASHRIFGRSQSTSLECSIKGNALTKKHSSSLIKSFRLCPDKKNALTKNYSTWTEEIQHNWTERIEHNWTERTEHNWTDRKERNWYSRPRHYNHAQLAVTRGVL